MNKKVTFYFFLAISLIVIITGCQSKHLHKSKMMEATRRLAYNDSIMIAKRNAGVDFIAKGEKPVSWTLEMDYDRAFIFKSAGGLKISCAPSNVIFNKEKNNEISSNRRYEARGPNGFLEITIYKETCNINSQKNKVTVFTNDTLFEGCGNYLYNEQLNNRWILEEIDDRYPDLGDFPIGLPEMTLELSKKRMYGFDGCNSLSSEILIYGDRIQFGNILSTLKACDGVKTERVKWNMIDKHLVEYRFRNKELVLYLIDDSRLIFKPAY